MSRSLMNEWYAQSGKDAATLRQLFEGLPPVDPSKPNGERNRQIFRELLNDAKVSEVAREYGISPSTVRNVFRKGCRELSRKLAAQKKVEQYFTVVDAETLADVSGCSVALIKAAHEDPETFGIKLTAEEKAMLDGRLSGLSAMGIQQQNECLRDFTVDNIECASAMILDNFLVRLGGARDFLAVWNSHPEQHSWEHAAGAYHVTVEELKAHASDFSESAGRIVLFNAWCEGLPGLESAIKSGYKSWIWTEELRATFSDMRFALNNSKLNSGVKSMQLG